MLFHLCLQTGQSKASSQLPVSMSLRVIIIMENMKMKSINEKFNRMGLGHQCYRNEIQETEESLKKGKIPKLSTTDSRTPQSYALAALPGRRVNLLELTQWSCKFLLTLNFMMEEMKYKNKNMKSWQLIIDVRTTSFI